MCPFFIIGDIAELATRLFFELRGGEDAQEKAEYYGTMVGVSSYYITGISYGAFLGATTAAIAGPLGSVAGGFLGAAVGAFAGPAIYLTSRLIGVGIDYAWEGTKYVCKNAWEGAKKCWSKVRSWFSK